MISGTESKCVIGYMPNALKMQLSEQTQNRSFSQTRSFSKTRSFLHSSLSPYSRLHEHCWPWLLRLNPSSPDHVPSSAHAYRFGIHKAGESNLRVILEAIQTYSLSLIPAETFPVVFSRLWARMLIPSVAFALQVSKKSTSMSVIYYALSCRDNRQV